MENQKQSNQTGCCPKFNPEPWRERELKWDNKLFVTDNVLCFFHIPLNIGPKITKNMKKIEKVEASNSKSIILAQNPSPWREVIYIPVTKDVPNCKMATISGTFLAKVFEGQYKNAPIWEKKMKEYVKNKGKEAKKIYFGYTTCPKCAQEYGKNYVILFAKV